MPHANKLALITGAVGGIGTVLAQVLAEHNWNLALNDLSVDSLHDLRQQLSSHTVQVHTVAGDVASETDVENCFDATLQHFQKPPDLLINNAAVQTWKPLIELSLAEWERTLATNLTGCFLTMRSFARQAVKYNQSGVVINIGSGCNKLAFPNLADYTASKGGIEMLTKSAALELGAHGIRVNCIAPGAIETARTQQESNDYARSWASLTPLRRVGQPEDIANAVLLLADDKAGFISGQTIGVDGGLFARAPWPENY